MQINMISGYLENFNLSEYYYQKKVIPDPQILLADIEGIVRRRSEISDSLLNARVFINNGTRDDFGYCVSNNPPHEEENLKEWLERITGASSFCAVINGVNGWSDTLAERINRDFNQEWIKKYGIPSQGIDVYTFMGKYNITPFGIHKDQEHTFLYHLGPGIKRAWVWDPKVKDISPFVQSDSFNLEETLSWAEAIVLEPGDALFIPQNWYHVLENPEFSVTLGIAPYENKRTELMTLFLSDFLSVYGGEDSVMHLDIRAENKFNEYASSMISSDIAKVTLNDIAHKGLIRLLNRLKSNNYFKYTSPQRKVMNKNYLYFGDLVVGEQIGDKVQIYLRGKEFLVSEQAKKSLEELHKLLCVPGFTYRFEGNNADNLFNQIITKMITSGVLI